MFGKRSIHAFHESETNFFNFEYNKNWSVCKLAQSVMLSYSHRLLWKLANEGTVSSRSWSRYFRPSYGPSNTSDVHNPSDSILPPNWNHRTNKIEQFKLKLIHACIIYAHGVSPCVSNPIPPASFSLILILFIVIPIFINFSWSQTDKDYEIKHSWGNTKIEPIVWHFCDRSGKFTHPSSVPARGERVPVNRRVPQLMKRN